jgi:hypothetical protein
MNRRNGLHEKNLESESFILIVYQLVNNKIKGVCRKCNTFTCSLTQLILWNAEENLL